MIIDESEIDEYTNFKISNYETLDLVNTDEIDFIVGNNDYDQEFLLNPENEDILRQEIENNFWTLFTNTTIAMNRDENTQIPGFSIWYNSQRSVSPISLTFDIEIQRFEQIPNSFGKMEWTLVTYKVDEPVSLGIPWDHIVYPQDLTLIIVGTAAGVMFMAGIVCYYS